MESGTNFHSIYAFANDIDNWSGGYIIIGVEEENGMPIFPVKGLEKSSIDRINKELLQKCNLMEPRYIQVVELLKYDRKYYIRKMSNSIKANQLEEKELFMLSGSVPFDNRANIAANVENMRPSLIS